MTEFRYRIVMQVPIGERSGKMVVYQDGGQINGVLNILNHSEPFRGSIDRDGNCKIEGRFVTLLRKVSYFGTGTIGAKEIHLILRGERHIYEIDGEACPEEAI